MNENPPHLNPQTYPRILSVPSLNIHIELTFSPLDPSAALQTVSSPAAGANVLFLGTTRDTFQGRSVVQLSYTSYPLLALKTLRSIAEEAVATHGLKGVYIAHRMGVVPISEASIVIAVSAGHRKAGWVAGEEILERCKEKAEIWKEEIFEDGGREWRANRDTDGRGNIIS